MAFAAAALAGTLLSTGAAVASKALKKSNPTAKPVVGSFAPMQAPTEYSSDVVEAGRDVRREAAKRRGYMATIKAGETNSNASYASTAGVRSLMGIA